MIVDGKGRIAIPAEVRKTLDIRKCDKLDLLLFVSEGKIEIYIRGDRNA